LVRLRGAELPPNSPGYERRVLDRVGECAGGQLTPIVKLVAQYADGGYHWQRRLVGDAVLDARRLGLIARSDGGFATALIASGLASAALLAPLWPNPSATRFGPDVTALFVGWLLLSLIGGLLLSAISIGEVAAIALAGTHGGKSRGAGAFEQPPVIRDEGDERCAGLVRQDLGSRQVDSIEAA
jgi:hypothetical protein